MNRKYAIIGAAAFLLTFASLQPGFAKNSDENSSSSTSSGQHDDINSGRDFGQHVSDMNDHFSGDRNPGGHHKGYSGLKD